MRNDDFYLEPAPVALPFDDPSSVERVVSARLCDSCGGPTGDGDLCDTCEHTFGSILVTKHDKTIQAEDAFAAALDITPVEPAQPLPPVPPAATPSADVAVAPAATTVASAAAAVASAPTPRHEPVSTVLSAAPPVIPPKPDAIPEYRRDAVKQKPALQGRGLRAFVGFAALVIAGAAVGVPLGRLLLDSRKQTVVAEKQNGPRKPTPVVSPPQKKTVEVSRSTPAVPSKASAAVAERPVTAARPTAPLTAARPTAPPRPVRPARPSTLRTASIALPTVPVAAPAEVALPAPEPVAVAAPAVPDAPAGPFFESRQVDQAPNVVARVEPRVPNNLQSGGLNEILVVRVLVSQAGQPSLISFLRRSKAGPELDDAVAAAVKQWTFTPAMRRGQAVSCYLNVGVPIRR
jgi:Gram-negative bacterial TonB protein C-terminal